MFICMHVKGEGKGEEMEVEMMTGNQREKRGSAAEGSCSENWQIGVPLHKRT